MLVEARCDSGFSAPGVARNPRSLAAGVASEQRAFVLLPFRHAPAIELQYTANPDIS
jgi:hypothetical protein